ncbi:tigger transposable element-derived protein 1 [Trichonephila clavata]|uniref:Tigger transposable element-derived protein 1 n=1 Tax=Trichonephila clavata TaxID=2740835 RepID=A0A8X6J4N8_TRICU|nr:tigger transposable element-derived protein 1 [Trichonephila clavata]
MIYEGAYIKQTIFNGHETRLLWKKMPKRNFITCKEKTIPVFKAAEDRLTMMVGVIAGGAYKLKRVLVYRSENPRALKDKSKPKVFVIWRSNRKAGVTASLFEDRFGPHIISEQGRLVIFETKVRNTNV